MKYSIKNYAQALTGIMLQKEFLAKEDVLVKNFLKLLERNGDIKKLKQIVALAEILACKKVKKNKILIEFARQLKESQKKTIEKVVKEGDILEEKISPSLIAGIRITLNGSLQLDGSLSNKIKKLF